MVIPRQGEQIPVEIISYLGYSPPKCTCHGKQSHSSNFMNLLECPHAQNPCLESSPTPSHMPKPNASKIISFQNKIYLFLKTHYRVSVKYWTTLRGESVGQPSKTIHGPLRRELLNNLLTQFSGKSSVEILFTNIFVFVSFHVMHSLLIF